MDELAEAEEVSRSCSSRSPPNSRWDSKGSSSSSKALVPAVSPPYVGSRAAALRLAGARSRVLIGAW